MINEFETFQDTWPYKANFFYGDGFKHHYVDEGDNKEKIIVCLPRQSFLQTWK